MRLIPYDRLTATPWKNGGGETREIAAFPPGAGFDDFAWRLSIATIAEGGAFSSFPGIDRTLILLSGRGVALQLDSGPDHVLHPGDSLDFAGEQAVRSRLLDGPVRDLNVMTRRGLAAARVDRVTLEDRAVCDLGNGGGAIILRDGQASLSDGTPVGPGDTILHDPGKAGTVVLTGHGDLVRVRFRRIDGASGHPAAGG